MIEARIKEVDTYLSQAQVSVGSIDEFDLQLARKFCDHFDLKWGSLLRRARAVELAGGNFRAECIQEHLLLSG